MTTADVTKFSSAELFKFADQLEAAGRMGEVATILAHLVTLHPQKIDVQERFARILIGLKEYGAAEAPLRRVIALHKKPKPEIFHWLGLSLAKQRQYAAALEPLTIAVERDPGDASSQLTLADTLYMAGKPDIALRRLEKARKVFPKSVDVAVALAEKLYYAGKYAEAAQAAEAALKLGDRGDALLRLLGRAYGMCENLEAAQKAFAAAISLDFDASAAHDEWMQCLIDVLGVDRAITWLGAAPPDEARDYHIASLSLRAGRPVEAYDAVSSALVARPSSLLLLGLAAQVAASQGRWQAATRDAEKVWDAVSRMLPSVGNAVNTRPRDAVQPGQLTKSVYMPVELSSREFDARLLLACRLAGCGVATVIGSKSVLGLAAPYLPAGLFLLKTLNHYDTQFILRTMTANHRYAAVDEESLGWLDLDEYVSTGVDPEIINVLDVVIANSELHRQTLVTHFPSLASRISVAGNVRLELCEPRFDPLYAAETDELRKQYAPAVIVCTNFGGFFVSHFDYTAMCATMLEAGNRAPLTPSGQRVVAQGKASVLPEAQNVAALIEFIPALSANFPNLKIVLRPHPMENDAIWHSRFKDIPNLVVTKEGSLQAWLRVAEAAIYFSGCTSGVEAHLSGALAIRFTADPTLQYPKYGLSAHINPMASSTSELMKHVADALQVTKRPREEDSALISRYILRDGAPQSQRIATVIDDYLAGCQATGETVASIDAIKNALREGARMRALTPHSNQKVADAKKINVSLADVVAAIRRLQSIVSELGDITVVELAPGAFLISRPDS